MKKILITGGAGYVGASLVPKLLNKGYKVTVYDLMIYGDTLDHHPNLNIVSGDIRDISLLNSSLKNQDIVLHLACISNDPSFELNPQLGKSINFDCFEPFLKKCISNKIQKFIYASSSSVYGVKKVKNVTEDELLEPLTDYSKFKADCEKILAKYQSETFSTTTIRPATVCGYSKRQRFDLVVNLLTNLAFNNKKITVLGGDQLRPNIHIDDMCDLYITIIESPKKNIDGETFNVGYDNESVMNLARNVKSIIGDNVEIIKLPTNDNRSYHISSSKIKNKIGFIPKKTVLDAIKDLKNAFNNNLFQDSLNNEKYFNIKMMQKINLH